MHLMVAGSAVEHRRYILDCAGALKTGKRGNSGQRLRLLPHSYTRATQMVGNTQNSDRRLGSRGRIAGWGSAAALLLLPALAMQLTDEVNWDETDFAVFGAMLASVGLAFEFLARKTGSNAYRTAVGVALAAAFILVWMNLAVGIIGTEDNPANLMFGGVLAVGIIGAVIARFQPDGMAHALFATALAQTLVAAIALIARMHQSPVSPAIEILGLTGFFAALWLTSAWLFRKAAREQSPADAAPPTRGSPRGGSYC